MDGLLHGVTLEPQVVFVLPLGEQAAAVARAAPLPQRAQTGQPGAGTREERQEVQDLLAVHGLGTAAALVDSVDQVQPTVPLLFQGV